VGQSHLLKSDGERLFAAYCHQRRLPWEYEPLINGRRPDFLVEHPRRRFVAEVYEPELRLPTEGAWFSSYPAIRSAFEGRKRRQVAAVKEAGLPYVAVVARTNSDIRFDPLTAAGAMFGDLTVVMPIGVPTTEVEAVTTFGGGGRLQPGQMRGVSAVAILERFNPTIARVDAAMEEQLSKLPDWSATMTEREIAEITREIGRIHVDTHEAMIRSGAFDPEARRARMIVLHNPHATHPLGLDVLNDADDSQWCAIVDDGVARYRERGIATTG